MSNSRITEVVVTTVCRRAGRVHIAPMGSVALGLPAGGRGMVLQPFKPSTTLDNILATGCAVANYTTDVRIIAGCLTGRRDWPTVAAREVPCVRLADTLAHAELSLEQVDDDPLRPRLTLRVLREENHAPFRGFNRAQGAVLEAAILVSRLDLLPADKIDREIEYLKIAIDKTAGPDEREAWGWLMERIAERRRGQGP